MRGWELGWGDGGDGDKGDKGIPHSDFRTPTSELRIALELCPADAWEMTQSFRFSTVTMNSTHSLVPIHPPEFPTQFRALGRFRATLALSEENRPWLVFKDAKIPAFVFFKARAKVEALNGRSVIWSGHPRTDKSGNLASFRILGFFDVDDDVNFYSIRGRLKSWDVEKQLLRIEIRPNPNSPRNFKPFLITLSGILPNPRSGQFWNLEAALEKGKLVLVDGQPIDPKKHESSPSEKSSPTRQTQPIPPSDQPPSPPTEPTPPEPPVEVEPTMATAEITLKFNEIPTPKPLGKGRVEIALKDEATGLVFAASFKNKTWNKNLKKMEEFESWVGAVSGKLGERTEAGFSLESAGMQVFEKVKKPPKEEES